MSQTRGGLPSSSIYGIPCGMEPCRAPRMILSRLLNGPDHASNAAVVPSDTSTTFDSTTAPIATGPPDIIEVYGQWTRYDGMYPKSPEDFIRKIHVYSVTIPPSTPIFVDLKFSLPTEPAGFYRTEGSLFHFSASPPFLDLITGPLSSQQGRRRF